jgi:gas vesicle protein
MEGITMANDRSGAGAYLGWFLFGAMVGGLTAVLLTPKTGEQSRDLLGERGSDLARRAQELAAEAQGRAGEWLDKSRDIFEEQTQRLMGAFEAGRDAMREEMRKMPPRA